MGDKKYVKLKPSKMGFRYRGMVRTKHRSLLTEVLRVLKSDMAADWDRRVASKEIFWLNVWQDDNDREDDDARLEVSDPRLAKQLHKWCRKAARKYCERNAILDGYGFVINPIGSQQQVWHIDYSTDAAVVWIPITPFTEQNAVQYLTLPDETPKRLLDAVASHVDEVDAVAIGIDADYCVVQQMISRPMSILYMGRGTIHRGIANTGVEHCIAFYVSVHFIKNYRKHYHYESESLEGIESSVETLV